jgi:hypothetical protein
MLVNVGWRRVVRFVPDLSPVMRGHRHGPGENWILVRYRGCSGSVRGAGVLECRRTKVRTLTPRELVKRSDARSVRFRRVPRCLPVAPRMNGTRGTRTKIESACPSPPTACQPAIEGAYAGIPSRRRPWTSAPHSPPVMGRITGRVLRDTQCKGINADLRRSRTRFPN